MPFDDGRFTFWVPLKEQVHKFVNLSRMVSKKPKILTVGCGQGLESYLFALESGTEVIGIDNSEEAIKIAKETYSLPNLSFIVGDIHNLPEEVKNFDLVFNSYMPEGVDFSKSIRKLNPKIIVYIYDEKYCGEDNDFEEEDDEIDDAEIFGSFSEEVHSGYFLLDKTEITSWLRVSAELFDYFKVAIERNCFKKIHGLLQTQYADLYIKTLDYLRNQTFDEIPIDVLNRIGRERVAISSDYISIFVRDDFKGKAFLRKVKKIGKYSWEEDYEKILARIKYHTDNKNYNMDFLFEDYSLP